jgi:glutamyl-Q tRNA(Asp) synthetase
MTVPYRGRFAPSPSGDLHFGSLVAALGSWLRARAEGGTWIVRIEDLDPPREVAGAAARILATLGRFGMHSDEPVRYQSTRHGHYLEALQRLQEKSLAFPCTCSRRQLEASDGVHRLACTPTPGATPAWRARVPGEIVEFDDLVCGRYGQHLREDVGDFVLCRSDRLWAYQLAVVVDDAEQGISEVVRGADLLDSTPRQIWLQRQLGLPTPSYLHLPLVLGDDGRKLSKSLASMPLDDADPLPALRAAHRVLGQDPIDAEASMTNWLQLAVERFDVRKIPASVPSRIAESSV